MRLRAQVLRLSHRGSTVGQIAAYTGRSQASVCRDLDRWEQRGLERLADGTAPGNPPRITGEVRAFLEEKLSEERTWNATQLAEAVAERFGVEVTSEAIRQHLSAMGYRWKRTRYVPSRPPDPEEERKARDELEGLKRGLSRAR
jgi:transposase